MHFTIGRRRFVKMLETVRRKLPGRKVKDKRCKIGPAKWSGNDYRLDGTGHSDEKFLRAVSAEKKKAKRFYASFGTRGANLTTEAA